MNCALFSKMDQVFRFFLKKFKNWKMGGKIGKVGEFCQSEKVGTIQNNNDCTTNSYYFLHN